MVSRRVHPAHGPGGLERHVFDLVSQLAARGVEVDLFTETPPREAQRRAERAFPDGVTPHWVKARRLPIGTRKGTVVLDRITNYPVWSRRVAASMIAHPQAQAWAVVHAHGLAGWGVARARPGGRSTPLVVTTHGLEEFRSNSWLKHWAYAPFRAGIRSVANRSDAVVTTDTSLVELVERFLRVPPAEQVVIPNAIDPEACRRRAEPGRGVELLQRLGLSDASPLFLSVGRVEANKGFTTLVDALAAASDDLPVDWRWVLVGDGPERRHVRDAIARAGLTGRAVLAGRLDDVELHSLFAVSSWFVHPTLYEGSSLVTLEAMAHGLPVVASRAGGLPDKVVDGETGFLVPPGDSDALSARLVVAAQSDGAPLGAAGQQLCEQRFSWDAVIPQYVALYERLATTSPVPTRPR